MSLDVAFWKAPRVQGLMALRIYRDLAEENTAAVEASPDVLAFRQEVLNAFPEWVEVLEPTQGANADRYVLLTLPFSWASEESMLWLQTTARRLDLVEFDPQTYDGPDDEDEDW